MLLRLLPTIFLLAVSTAQKTADDTKVEPQQNEEAKPQVYVATPLSASQDKTDGSVPQDVRQFFARQQFAPELYGLTYLQPQFQDQAALPRLQPQIVLYGSGGQGQPILINPGNPPGNFLIPQGPGPNVIVRNNPQGPQGSVFPGPVAGYPKPAHIPPIEKDAEEIPTNAAKIPPLGSDRKPTSNPRPKPEKLETFTEPNQLDQNSKTNQGRFPQLNPESVGLRPGQRFFVLNGDQIYNYPFEGQPEIQGDLFGLRYTNIQPFPQNPPKFLQPFAQEPPQFLQGGDGRSPQAPISVPDLLLRNSFVSSQPREPQQPQLGTNEEQPDKIKNDEVLKTPQQYFRTADLPPNQPIFLQNPQEYSQDYIVQQQGSSVDQPTLYQQSEGLKVDQETPTKDEVIQPQLVGQFRFTPNAVPGFYQYKDDLENDAIVVDATFDAPNNYDGRVGNLKEEENVSSTPQPVEKEVEPSMAQAGPQATAIAGPGGVAGSAPRGTAIAGKGGLAVSSPQATAVAGTKDEEKKRPVKKNS